MDAAVLQESPPGVCSPASCASTRAARAKSVCRRRRAPEGRVRRRGATPQSNRRTLFPPPSSRADGIKSLELKREIAAHKQRARVPARAPTQCRASSRAHARVASHTSPTHQPHTHTHHTLPRQQTQAAGSTEERGGTARRGEPVGARPPTYYAAAAYTPTPRAGLYGKLCRSSTTTTPDLVVE
jgi:hypothetical protein